MKKPKTFPHITELVYQPAGDILQLWAHAGRPSVNEYISNGVYAIVDAETDEIVGFEIIEFRKYVESQPDVFVEIRQGLNSLWAKSDEIVVRLNPTGQAEVKKALEYA